MKKIDKNIWLSASKKQETLRDFSDNEAHLKWMCRELECDKDEILFTKDEADVLAKNNSAYNELKLIMNAELMEIDA
ncbi:hypothetical protein AVENP_2841 [Arcobacter venerupis]|uniref:Uncharacterized protein n=1 Tax=Arcobacter venerupis TaxID=1054033 RepID=A0AAE7E5C0_9BACT|nr:hypothetical protein [Arcobacter venerupis]QKF68319.1 hypothetical protein AVENP_2841 [Arcobacter venerupis]RWS48507.1 hypothetical protein CKA56_13805 [Arcobacter venerupis]